ncbi:MAG: hypothetical protein IKD47_06175 [Clostridia bacterium]|nr:hypothetical protein [Clostridia bacterium]
MKIFITTAGKTRKIALPMKGVLSILLAKTQDEEVKKNRKKLLKSVMRCLKTYKKEYGSFVLLEAVEKDGVAVKIIV